MAKRIPLIEVTRFPQPQLPRPRRSLAPLLRMSSTPLSAPSISKAPVPALDSGYHQLQHQTGTSLSSGSHLPKMELNLLSLRALSPAQPSSPPRGEAKIPPCNSSIPTKAMPRP